MNIIIQIIILNAQNLWAAGASKFLGSVTYILQIFAAWRKKSCLRQCQKYAQSDSNPWI